MSAQAPAARLDLITPAMLEKYGERLSANEWPTVRCLDPIYEDMLPVADRDENAEIGFFLTMLRTGSIFLLDPEEASGAFGGVAPVMELPPLPFPRVIIEGHSWTQGQFPLFAAGRRALDYKGGQEAKGHSPGGTGRDDSYGFWSADESRDLDEDFPGEVCFMDMLVIAEVEPGQVWDIGMGYHFGEDGDDKITDAGILFSTDRVTPEGIIPKPGVEVEDADPSFDMVSTFVRSLAVTAAHLIVAERVPHREVVMPRHQRKSLRRATGIAESPRIYFVDIAGAGEHEEGHGDREYHHRWLVSGHWRLNPGGKTFVRHKGGVCSWVKPYVKGPPGAPWKGRPVHGRREAA